MRLQDKVALITESATGIGRASAILFAEEGAKVAVVDWATENGEKTVRMIRDAGGEAIFIYADISKTSHIKNMIKTTIDTYGKLNILFNNAASGIRPAPTVELTEEEWDKILSTSLKSVFLASKYAIPEMLKQGGGVIINTSSAGGLVGIPNHSAYCAAKGGVIQLTRVLALECIRQNIRVNCICPGTVRTPMIKLETAPELEEVWKKRQPIGRIAEP